MTKERKPAKLFVSGHDQHRIFRPASISKTMVVFITLDVWMNEK
jgi:hypothetical protein